jgi:hypothetical protein
LAAARQSAGEFPQTIRQSRQTVPLRRIKVISVTVIKAIRIYSPVLTVASPHLANGDLI